MKTRDDFMQSVWEKSEKAMAEERKKKVQRRRWAGGLAAACLTLVIGITSAGGAEELIAHLSGAAFPDEAVIEVQDADNAAAGETVSSPTVQYGEPSGSDSVQADSADDMEVAYDGTLPGAAKLSNEELQEELRKGLEDAEKSKDNDFLAYYCLPVGIEIAICTEKCREIERITGEAEVTEYMKWFYGLPEDQVLTDEEFQSLKEIPTGYYKFTMDLSWGADTEGVDLVYWIVGEVSLP